MQDTVNDSFARTSRILPPLDGEFCPAAVWNRSYRELVARDSGARPLAIVLQRADESGSVYQDRVLSAGHDCAALTLRYVERILKFLLWQRGACFVHVAGIDEVVPVLAQIYGPHGARAFDHAFMGETVHGRIFLLERCGFDELPQVSEMGKTLGRHTDGCRVGLVLGEHERTAAAMFDGRVVFTETIRWDPVRQKDPAYHLEGIHDSITRAAIHLPRVDAIGGSAAGVFVNNEICVGRLFASVSAASFEQHVRWMFFTLQQRWCGVPFDVMNDGEVSTLAGSISREVNAVLGITVGAQQTAGYVTRTGTLTPWLNALAFAPLDLHLNAPRDARSGDVGCGAQYFSQQGILRLATAAGFDWAEGTRAAERIVELETAMDAGDARAQRVCESLGVYFGYAVAHCAEFYDIDHVLILGGFAADGGGEAIASRATEVLRTEFPEIGGRIGLSRFDDSKERFARAAAAATLPALRAS